MWELFHMKQWNSGLEAKLGGPNVSHETMVVDCLMLFWGICRAKKTKAKCDGVMG